MLQINQNSQKSQRRMIAFCTEIGKRYIRVPRLSDYTPLLLLLCLWKCGKHGDNRSCFFGLLRGLPNAQSCRQHFDAHLSGKPTTHKHTHATAYVLLCAFMGIYVCNDAREPCTLHKLQVGTQKRMENRRSIKTNANHFSCSLALSHMPQRSRFQSLWRF